MFDCKYSSVPNQSKSLENFYRKRNKLEGAFVRDRRVIDSPVVAHRLENCPYCPEKGTIESKRLNFFMIFVRTHKLLI